jgi:hypothetical protein
LEIERRRGLKLRRRGLKLGSRDEVGNEDWSRRTWGLNLKVTRIEVEEGASTMYNNKWKLTMSRSLPLLLPA